MSMGKYVRKADPVDAAKIDAGTGDITVSDTVTVAAGDWLLHHEDGSFSTADDATFTAEYEAAPVENAPPADPPPDPAAGPVAV